MKNERYFKKDTVAIVTILYENNDKPKIYQFNNKEKAEEMYHRYLTEKLLIGEIEVTLSYRTSEGAFLFARKIKKYRSYEKWMLGE